MKVKLISEFIIINLIQKTLVFNILYPENVNFSQTVQKYNAVNATVVLIDNSAKNSCINSTYSSNATVMRGIWYRIFIILLELKFNCAWYYSGLFLLI